MKSISSLIKGSLAAALALALFPSAATAGQQDDQIAIQLGASVLGIANIQTATPQEQANALYQGRAILPSTVLKAKPGLVGYPILTSTIQTDALRKQILAATEAALLHPVTLKVYGKVSVIGALKPATVTVSATLDPKKTTASAILAYAALRVPNFGPGLVATAIEAAAANTGGVFVFNYKTTTALGADINKAASVAMSASLKPYLKGTINWTKFTQGATGQFLPNFSAIPNPKGSISQNQPANIRGLAHAAGAVSANAAAALQRNLEVFGVNPTAQSMAVQNLATALVKGASAFQKTSLAPGLGALSGGSVAAAGFGLVTQYAGNDVSSWAASANNAILNAIVDGGIKGGGTANAYAFATGVAGGFAATYLSTHPGTVNHVTYAAFKSTNQSLISNSFITGTVKVPPSINGVTLDSVIEAAFENIYTAYYYKNWNLVSGAGGISTDVVGGIIKSLTFLNGVGSPVTDTVGL